MKLRESPVYLLLTGDALSSLISGLMHQSFNLKKLITLLLLILPFCISGCSKTVCELSTGYMFKNGSSHIVAVVTKTVWEIDSLVLLQNEMKVTFSNSPTLIYYDNRNVIKCADIPYFSSPARNPSNFSSYELTANDDGIYCYLYTFTDEDYQYTVEYGADLEALK